MFTKNLDAKRAIKVAAMTLIVISGLTLLAPTVIMASAQSSVTEVSAPGVKANEYYIFTQELNANEEKLGVPVAVYTLTNIIVHKGTMLQFISIILQTRRAIDIHSLCNHPTR